MRARLRFAALVVFVTIVGFTPYIVFLSLPYFLLPDRDSPENNRWVHHSDSDTAIVFIHGIFSDSARCWTNEDDEMRTVSFPQLVQKDENFVGKPSIFVAGYHTTVKAGKYGVGAAADEVWRGISRSIEGKPPVIDKRNIVFICHSTGGIVARYLLLEKQPELAGKNIGLMLVASPSGGSEFANLIGPLASLYNSKLTRELRQNNPLLDDLDDRFREFVYRRREMSLAGVEAFEQDGLIGRVFALVVSKESASRYFGKPIPLPAQDHMSSVKPRDKTHPTYKLLIDFYNNDFRRMVENTARLTPPFEAAERRMQTDSGDILLATISPDGRHAAYAKRTGPRQQLIIADLNYSDSAMVLRAPESKKDVRYYRGITFDQRGDWIYYVRSRQNARVHDLYRVTRNGSNNVKVLEDVDSAIAFNPAKPSEFAFCHGNPNEHRSEVLIATLNGSEAKIQPTPRAIRVHPSYFRTVSWSPSGSNLLAITGELVPDEMSLNIISADGQQKEIANDRRWRSIDTAVWLSSGEILFSAISAEGGPRRIWLTRPSGGKTVDVTRDLGSYRSISASADGKRLLALHEVIQSKVYIASAGSSDPEIEISHTGSRFDGVDGLSAGEDGAVIFTRRAGSSRDLMYFDPLARDTRVLVSGEGVNESPTICRRAGFAVFARTLGGKKNIWKVTLDEEAQTTRITDGVFDSAPSCSPDGRRIAYSRINPATGARSLWMTENGTARQVAALDVRNPVFSRDGNRLAMIYADPADHHRWRVGIMDIVRGEMTPYNGFTLGTNLAPRLRWGAGDALSVVTHDPRAMLRSREIASYVIHPGLLFPGVTRVFDFDWCVPGSLAAYAGGTLESDIVTFTEPPSPTSLR